jgi:hypothetical protein
MTREMWKRYSGNQWLGADEVDFEGEGGHGNRVYYEKS